MILKRVVSMQAMVPVSLDRQTWSTIRCMGMSANESKEALRAALIGPPARRKEEEEEE